MKSTDNSMAHLVTKRKQVRFEDDVESPDFEEKKYVLPPKAPSRILSNLCCIEWTPLRIVLAVGAAITGLLIWYWALLGWGTVAPPFIFYYTAPFRGPNIGPPPHDWKPTSRFVIRYLQN